MQACIPERRAINFRWGAVKAHRIQHAAAARRTGVRPAFYRPKRPLRYYRIERDMGQGFEPVANVPVTWSRRWEARAVSTPMLPRSTPIQTYTDTGDLRRASVDP